MDIIAWLTWATTQSWDWFYSWLIVISHNWFPYNIIMGSLGLKILIKISRFKMWNFSNVGYKFSLLIWTIYLYFQEHKIWNLYNIRIWEKFRIWNKYEAKSSYFFMSEYEEYVIKYKNLLKKVNILSFDKIIHDWIDQMKEFFLFHCIWDLWDYWHFWKWKIIEILYKMKINSTVLFY